MQQVVSKQFKVGQAFLVKDIGSKDFKIKVKTARNNIGEYHLEKSFFHKCSVIQLSISVLIEERKPGNENEQRYTEPQNCQEDVRSDSSCGTEVLTAKESAHDML